MTGNGIDTTVSHSARIWDYWLGGTENYAVDREVGDRIEEMLPDIVRQAREDRLFLGRVVRYLAGEAGIRQFLDIGTGLPTADNTHQVAQRVAPESKDLVEPGVVPLVQWRPDPDTEQAEIYSYCGVGRKV
jgi:hypothetical protein